jgi:hypothetical protein
MQNISIHMPAHSLKTSALTNVDWPQKLPDRQGWIRRGRWQVFITDWAMIAVIAQWPGGRRAGRVADAKTLLEFAFVSFRKLTLRSQPMVLLAITLAAVLSVSGCQSTGGFLTSWSTDHCDSGPGLLVQQLFERACDAAVEGDPNSPDYFYESAIAAWPFMLHGDGDSLTPTEASRVYHASVVGLLMESQRHGRYRPGQISVQTAGVTRAIPVMNLDLPWKAEDVNQIIIVDPDAETDLQNYHAAAGVGVPVVGLHAAKNASRGQDQFYPKRLPFSATAVLRPPSDRSSAEEGGVLELYNPLKVCTLQVDGQTVAMARDISAPFEFQLRTGEKTGMLGFLQPDVPEDAEGLRFVEPYQPGKIPIVFVHGLLSDPSTWFDTANDLREEAWFNERYQIWSFRYASGKPFVTSAMLLRSQLKQAVATLDPQGIDPALQQMVLVGHSMGGLVSKLQVAESEERIWNSFASVPFESLQGPPAVRARLAEGCFFEPQPFVRRVIFLATPHGGSSFAARGIGRLGSALVRPAEATTELHEQLVAANREAFSSQFERRVPTSMDMLETDDPTLLAIRTMRVSPRVRLHSIIGTGGMMLGEGPGDGIVTVESALHPGVVSQRFVDATHTEVQHHPDSQAEIRAILRAHLVESGLSRSPAPTQTEQLVKGGDKRVGERR